jgi:outer membrane immunogenic protein
MKNLPAGLVLLVALAPIGSAHAADMPVKAAPSAYNWTGCFVGINGGGAASDNAWQPLGGAVLATTNPNGLFGGGQIGCDYQAGPLVVGIEGQVDWINAKNAALSQGGTPFEVRSEFRTLGTVAARIGYAFDRILPYAKVGLAGARYWQELDAAAGPALAPFFGGNQKVFGIAAGAGVEVAVFSNLSFKAEYTFASLGTNGATLNCINPACAPVAPIPPDIRQNYQSVLFGVNYRFGVGQGFARY